jgi:hypothetical protein
MAEISNEQVKQLELRIVELEKKLELATKRTSTAKLSAEELKAYTKVRDILAADYGDFCGINDCFRCVVVRCGGYTSCVTRCIQRCIQECTCGPCNIGYLQQGLNSFSNLGE